MIVKGMAARNSHTLCKCQAVVDASVAVRVYFFWLRRLLDRWYCGRRTVQWTGWYFLGHRQSCRDEGQQQGAAEARFNAKATPHRGQSTEPEQPTPRRYEIAASS